MRLIRVVLRVAAALIVLAVVLLAGLRVAAHFRESVAQEAGLPAEGRLVDTGSGRIYLEERGGPGAVPVLLVHGSVGWAGLWRQTMDVLAAGGYRAAAMDLPPMGWSDRAPDADFGRVAQAGRIAGLARALGTRPILVAHSFGAGPALEAALREPGLFSGIVVVSGALALGGHERDAALPLPLRPAPLREAAVSATVTNPHAMGRLVGLFLYRKEAVTGEVVAILNAPMRREGTTGALAAWLPSLLVPSRDALSTRPEALAGLALPAALIWGDRDTTTPLDQGRALAAAMPGAPLAVLRDVGHIPQIEDPDGFHAALLAALGQVRAAP